MAESGNMDEILLGARMAREKAIFVLREAQRLQRTLSESVDQAVKVRRESVEIETGAKRRYGSIAPAAARASNRNIKSR
jgi:hypothetical protein